MTGFIKGLFRKKKQETTQDSPPVTPQNQGAYFLEPDDAKTFGNIDYMRTSKTITRTFAKGAPRVRQVSSTADEDATNPTPPSISMGSTAAQTPSQTSSSSSSFSSPQSQRRTADANMEMFRNMAKEIRKR